MAAPLRVSLISNVTAVHPDTDAPPRACPHWEMLDMKRAGMNAPGLKSEVFFSINLDSVFRD